VPLGDECRPRTVRSGSVTANLAKFGFQCLFVKPLASKCLAGALKISFFFRCLLEIHQISAVIRSGEYRS
jgi:hypothetical protein